MFLDVYRTFNQILVGKTGRVRSKSVYITYLNVKPRINTSLFSSKSASTIEFLWYNDDYDTDDSCVARLEEERVSFCSAEDGW